MITIDKMSRTPIYEQLVNQFEIGILAGDISTDGLLPSVRSLSVQLGINPNTLQKAYSELERRGLCFTVPGSGRFVSPEAIDMLKSRHVSAMRLLREQLESARSAGVTQAEALLAIREIYADKPNTENSEVN